MASTTRTHRLNPDEAALLRTPRDDFVREAQSPDAGDGDLRFTQDAGPFVLYERSLGPETREADGSVTVTETIRTKLDIPFWGGLFRRPVSKALANPQGRGHNRWWLPPDRVDAHTVSILALLAILSATTGYLGTLITQTVHLAVDEFGGTTTDQANLLSSVRIGVLLALALVWLADIIGRRPILLATAFGGVFATALGAIVPSLFWLGVTQTVARAGATALALVILIVAAEEVPAGSRAFATSILALAAALGAGFAVIPLPIAAIDEQAWRILYALPLLFLFPLTVAARRLPESRRFTRKVATAPAAAPVSDAEKRVMIRRLTLLAFTGFLGAMFLTPSSQFQNTFLEDEHGFGPAMLALFTVTTSTPGGIGMVIGGRLADIRGRKVVAVTALVTATVLRLTHYMVGGVWLWLAALLAVVIGAATVPSLGVYGPELFPTSRRGLANGIITLTSVVGSVVGLQIVGNLADRWGSFGPALAVVAFAPLLYAVLVATKYPETVNLELEDINPTRPSAF